MSLSKNEMVLSRPCLTNLEALKENKNLEQDIVTFSSYSLLFELLACSVCKTNHGFRYRGNEFRCTSACSPQCLAILIKNGVAPSSTSVQPPEAQTKAVQNGFSSLAEPTVEVPPLENGVNDQKIMQFIQFTTAEHEKAQDLPNGQGTAGLPSPRMVRPKSAAGVEEAENEVAEVVKTGSPVPKSDPFPASKPTSVPASKSPFSIKTAADKPTSVPTLKSKPYAPTLKTVTLKSASDPPSKPETPVQTQKSAPKPAPAEPVKADRKWTIDDLKMSPVFSEPGGEYRIVYSWDATTHVLHSDKLEEEVFQAMDALNNYYVGVHNQPLKSLPEPLEVICALFSVDNGLYRCVVLNVFRERESVLVKYLDFGADEEVPLARCYPVCQEVMEKYPIMGLEFHLSLPGNVKYVPTIDELPLDYLKDTAVVTMKVEGEINSIVWKGQLMLKDGTNLIRKMPFTFAGDQLEVITESEDETDGVQNIQADEEGRVRNPFKKEVVKEALHVSSSGEDSGVQDMSPKSVKQASALLPTPAPAKPVATVTPAAASPAPSPSSTTVTRRKKAFSFHSMNLTSSLTDEAKVKISFNWSAAKLTIVATADAQNLADFEDVVYQYAQTAPALTAVPEVNTVVVAPYEEGGFYRGRVASKEGDNLTVEFFDLGDSVTLPYGECLQISPELFKIPVYGVILKIDGIPDSIPATSVPEALVDKQWTLETTEKTNIFNWVGQLWDDKEVSYAEHVLGPKK